MREMRTHIAQMVSQCDSLNVCPSGSVAKERRIVLASPKWRGMLPLWRWPAVFSLIVVCIGLGMPVYAQDTPSDPGAAPVLASPPPSSQERLLAPVPTQFDWLRREPRSNLLLETLLGLQEQPTRLFMSATLAEEYSDNFTQDGDSGDGREEFRTILSLGTVYRLDNGQSFVSLANSLSGNYQARSGDSDIGFVNLALNAGHQVSRLALALSESLTRDDDTGLTADSTLRRERRPFLRNRLSPQMRYAFNRLTSMALAYTNTIVQSEGGTSADDSLSHAVAASVEHRFSRLFTGSGSYSFTTNNSDGGADTQSHHAAVDFGYLVDRRTSLIFQLFGLITERREGGNDSHSYGTSVGMRRQFTSFLGAFVSVGAMVFEREDEEPRVFPTWQVALDGALPVSRYTTLTLTSQQSIGDTADEVDNVGIVLRQAVTFRVNHVFTPALLSTVFVSFIRTEQLEDSVGTSESVRDRDDTFWQAGAQASYALSRAVSFSLVYLYQHRGSTQAGGDFDENRVTLSVSSGFSLF
jgi:predicted porin